MRTMGSGSPPTQYTRTFLTRSSHAATDSASLASGSWFRSTVRAPTVHRLYQAPFVGLESHAAEVLQLRVSTQSDRPFAAMPVAASLSLQSLPTPEPRGPWL